MDPLSIDSDTTCGGFEGNADLYGLGIRIGVYLQWYSTWICITVDPETSAETHTANALFMFAIMVALLQAIGNQSINNVEAYLMLQICFGYLLTLLSVFGLRLQLLHPRSAQRITSTFLGLLSRKSKEPPRSKSLMSIINMDVEKATSTGMIPTMFKIFVAFRSQTTTLRLSELNNLKEGTLSWIGVFWRISIATIVSITNAIVVFDAVKPPLPVEGLCRGTGFIFMFAKWELSGPRLIFVRIGAVAIAAFFGFLASVTVTTFSRVVVFLEGLAVGDFLLLFLGTVASAKVRQTVLTGAQKLHRLFRDFRSQIGMTSVYFPLAISAGSPLLYMTVLFLDAVLEALVSIKDSTSSYEPGQVFSLYALFSSGSRIGKASKDVVETDATKDKITTRWIVLTGLWHFWIVGATMWFIVSVELTIRWNKISGIHTIESTGQLIPFVVGVASFIRAKHKLVVFAIKRWFPDWEKMDLEIVFIDATPERFRILKNEGDAKPSTLRMSNLPGACII